MNVHLYVTLVAAGATLGALYVAAGWAVTAKNRVKREIGYYRERRRYRAAVPMMYVEARDPYPRREALRLFARGLLR